MDTTILITNKYNIKFKITKIEYTYLNNERNTIIELCELEKGYRYIFSGWLDYNLILEKIIQLID